MVALASAACSGDVAEAEREAFELEAKQAAAQKLAEESKKNPPPEPAPKYKDPNKEGVRAKHEASIGLPIESDDPTVHVHTGVWKRPVNGSDIVIAVYPELPAGRYRFPASDQHRGSEVVVVSGQVAQLDLRLG